MSFGNTFKNFGVVQEALMLALMLVSMVVLFYVDIDFSFKLGIIVLVFAVIFLATLANQRLREEAEARKKAA
jgi:hypothetical protein